MHPVIQKCPVCGDLLEVTNLHCRTCDTGIDGHFTLGAIHSLTLEQIKFAETFIRCEGKIKRVEDELGISYPTVRARLRELIRAMGFDVADEEEISTPEPIDRHDILSQLASGALTAAEAAEKLAGN